jgi:hypothetical protein
MHEGSKTCPVCQIEKSFDKFTKDRTRKDGIRSSCRECNINSCKAQRASNRARKTIVIPTEKKCSRCKLTKPSFLFLKISANADGLDCYCQECRAKSSKEHDDKNKSREAIAIPDFKTCSSCKMKKPGLQFSKSRCNKDGLKDYCKGCSLIRERKSKYGISEEWSTTILTSQGGACPICGFVPGPEDKILCVDHDHSTGNPRGMLCSHCNTGLGHFKDSTETLQKAIDYLNKHK